MDKIEQIGNEMSQQDGETDESYIMIGNGLGQVFNIVVGIIYTSA
eukprot:CAMPEP_0205803568 /NCGR_PEP_ID=MMETSP0205-20121125/6262_1 /ASSEMBLY_ACC=CAM_ASM_000278 /TAXON_ID=36767 /ORGANISM="Euplotes focardii, Strain TN1" /LENGTH=44 /DNA_ID= /DNA_START= /DNA_END= /DNA_ORIENTATION=